MEARCSSSFFVSFSVDVSLLDSTLLLDSTTDTSPQTRRSQNILLILSPLQDTSSLVRIYCMYKICICHSEEFPVLVNPASTTNFFNLIQRMKALWRKAGHLVRGVVQLPCFLVVLWMPVQLWTEIHWVMQLISKLIVYPWSYNCYALIF